MSCKASFILGILNLTLQFVLYFSSYILNYYKKVINILLRKLLMDPLGHGYSVSGSMHLRFNLSLKARQRRRPTKILIYSQYPQLGQVLQIRLVQDGDVVSLEISESRKRTREHVMRIYRLMARCNFVAILFYQHPPPPQNTLTPPLPYVSVFPVGDVIVVDSFYVYYINMILTRCGLLGRVVMTH